MIVRLRFLTAHSESPRRGTNGGAGSTKRSEQGPVQVAATVDRSTRIWLPAFENLALVMLKTEGMHTLLQEVLLTMPVVLSQPISKQSSPTGGAWHPKPSGQGLASVGTHFLIAPCTVLSWFTMSGWSQMEVQVPTVARVSTPPEVLSQ